MTFRLEGPLVANLTKIDAQAQVGINLAAKYTATQTEAWMKNNATWTDRTGAARNGLRARVFTSGSKVAIVLYHSVPYGVYLETRWGGKYAIIRPALAYGGKLFAETVGAMIFKKAV